MTDIPFDNSYATLPEAMFTRLAPTPVKNPQLLAWNATLADILGINADDDITNVFSGNEIPDGASPLAQLYAGHQFGQWNPQLGDGRAILLGEVIDRSGQRRDIQLKGSGPTPYSRMGDGRAGIGPVIREYILSEAMHALGVPTTRALAAVTTGEIVLRDPPQPGAVFTRVAASHIRIGTFQVFAARGQTDLLQALFDHTTTRHYPDVKTPEELLQAVTEKQAQLIAKWMSLGFIHGVMNTDNMTLSGETIDYGPCAFMDGFHPMRVFSSIDQMGRYAYGNQPRIAVWNLAQLATALIPLMPDQETAIESFTKIINSFPTVYETTYDQLFAAKLGLRTPAPELLTKLLKLMETDSADFTATFTALAENKAQDQFLSGNAFAAWETQWKSHTPDLALAAKSNPRVIPRNHRVEETITAALSGDHAPFHALLAATTNPFTANPHYERPPTQEEAVIRTFCGT